MNLEKTRLKAKVQAEGETISYFYILVKYGPLEENSDYKESKVQSKLQIVSTP